MRIKDVHHLIVLEGKRKFNRDSADAMDGSDSMPAIEAIAAAEFHWSSWYTTKVRPFFVKNAGRELCVCIYHLRWEIMVESLFKYIKRIRHDLKLCNCKHTNLKSPLDFRRAHVCVRQTSQRYDEVGCVYKS